MATLLSTELTKLGAESADVSSTTKIEDKFDTPEKRTELTNIAKEKFKGLDAAVKLNLQTKAEKEIKSWTKLPLANEPQKWAVLYLYTSLKDNNSNPSLIEVKRAFQAVRKNLDIIKMPVSVSTSLTWIIGEKKQADIVDLTSLAAPAKALIEGEEKETTIFDVDLTGDDDKDPVQDIFTYRTTLTADTTTKTNLYTQIKDYVEGQTKENAKLLKDKNILVKLNSVKELTGISIDKDTEGKSFIKIPVADIKKADWQEDLSYIALYSKGDAGDNVVMVTTDDATKEETKKVDIAATKAKALDAAAKLEETEATNKAKVNLEAAAKLEAAKLADAKKVLTDFTADKITIKNFLWWVTGADYVTLFKKVAEKGTAAQIASANTYVESLTTWDLTVHGANLDRKPWLATFGEVANDLWQPDSYTAVKARIDKEVKAASAEKEAKEIQTTTMGFSNVNYVFTEAPSKQTLLLEARSEKSGVKILFTFDAAGYLKSFREIWVRAERKIPVGLRLSKAEITGDSAHKNTWVIDELSATLDSAIKGNTTSNWLVFMDNWDIFNWKLKNGKPYDGELYVSASNRVETYQYGVPARLLPSI